MYSVQVTNMDLGQIAESGQCFRMNYVGKGTYSIIAFGKYLEVSQYQNTLLLSCDEHEFETIWKQYFDLCTDYAAIIESAKADDYLSRAIQYSNGIRILKQDLWEILITFIISQRKSIPSIKRCVETLCYRYGDAIQGYALDGSVIHDYAFPTPEQLSKVTIEELRECGLGYRDIYVFSAAKWFCKNGDTYADKLDSYTYAKSVLMSIDGVGTKVANCICLFALHHLEACPIDTHMQQIIDKVYKGIMPEWMVSDKAGVYQQYAFYYKKSSVGKKGL